MQCFEFRASKMQNHWKLLLLTSCFGSLCLLILNIMGTSSNRDYVHKNKKTEELHLKVLNKLSSEETNELNPSKIDEVNSEDNIDKQEAMNDDLSNNENLSNELRSKIENEFQNRRTRVEYVCSNLEGGVDSSLHDVVSKLVIDIKHKLTWCPVYKSASSMWMKNFAMLSGLSTTENLNFVHKNSLDYHDIVKQKFQQSNNIEDRLYQISMTTKFIVVRHPFERLLSAYRDKLEHMQGREYYYKHYGQYITQKYRSKQSNLTSLEPSFMEFLEFIAKEQRFDEHWIPISHSCLPCSIDYDYIFKFESLSDEYNYFIVQNDLQYYSNYLKFERENTSLQGRTNDVIAEKYFKEIPSSLLLNLFEIYELDFLLFSYSPAKYYYMTNEYKDQPLLGLSKKEN